MLKNKKSFIVKDGSLLSSIMKFEPKYAFASAGLGLLLATAIILVDAFMSLVSGENSIFAVAGLTWITAVIVFGAFFLLIVVISVISFPAILLYDYLTEFHKGYAKYFVSVVTLICLGNTQSLSFIEKLL